MAQRSENYYAQVVKSVDTLVSGTSDRKVVKVRVLSWAQFFNYLGICPGGEIGRHASFRD